MSSYIAEQTGLTRNMETGSPFNQKNFRSEARSELKLANKAWTDCISKNYMN